ncbi:MAG: arginine--tRNA ligase, partial [Alphaproteobacteria bacterium]
MDYFKYLREEIIKRLEELAEGGKLPSGFDSTKVTVEPPRDPSHGDVSSNAAMVVSSQVGMKPRELGEMLAASLEGHEAVAAVKLAGPGFLNMELKASFWHARLKEVLTAGMDYGRSDIGAGEKVNVEYVSANPTGPLHIGHGRGAVIGDVLASLLEWVGFEVTREYYVNDAGRQVDNFAKAIYRDMRRQAQLPVEQPDLEELYPGKETADCAMSVSAFF